MPSATSLLGLALGMLLAAAGLTLRDGFRRAPGLSRAVWAIRWTAGGLLLAAVPLLWNTGQLTPVLHLTLMAAIAAPPTGRRHPWNNVINVLPALTLTGISFFLVTRTTPSAGSTITPASLASMICAGLAARVLGEALGVLARPATPPSRLFDVLYLLLTLLVGVNALTTLWQRGVVWRGTAAEGGTAGMWLAWSAAWLSPRKRLRLRAGLIALAAVLFILLALGTS